MSDHYGEGWKLCAPRNWVDRFPFHKPHWIRPGDECGIPVHVGGIRELVPWGAWECASCHRRQPEFHPAPGERVDRDKRILYWCMTMYGPKPSRKPPQSPCHYCKVVDWRRVDEAAYGPLPVLDPDAEPEEPTMAELEAAGQGSLPL